MNNGKREWNKGIGVSLKFIKELVIKILFRKGVRIDMRICLNMFVCEMI